MPRVLMGVKADSRSSISLAALLVKVTASTDSVLACPVASSQAIRVVSTRVLPLPAPARMSADPCGRVTAASCSGLRLTRSGEGMLGEATHAYYIGESGSRLSIAREFNRLCAGGRSNANHRPIPGPARGCWRQD